MQSYYVMMEKIKVNKSIDAVKHMPNKFLYFRVESRTEIT